MLSPAVAASSQNADTLTQAARSGFLLPEGGRKLTWERSFGLEREVKPKRSFWTKLVDVVAGPPDFRYLVNPYSVTTDSKGRIIVTRSRRQRRSHLRFRRSRSTSS